MKKYSDYTIGDIVWIKEGRRLGRTLNPRGKIQVRIISLHDNNPRIEDAWYFRGILIKGKDKTDLVYLPDEIILIKNPSHRFSHI